MLSTQPERSGTRSHNNESHRLYSGRGRAFLRSRMVRARPASTSAASCAAFAAAPSISRCLASSASRQGATSSLSSALPSNDVAFALAARQLRSHLNCADAA